MNSNINLRVDLKMKCFIQLARKCIVDNIEEEIEKTDNEDLRKALIDKLTEVLENELILQKPKTVNLSSISAPVKKIPVEPVNVKGTPMFLKNMNINAYRNFCKNISDTMGYEADFSDAPFNNLPRNSRIYVAIKKLYSSGKIDQESLDNLVLEAENIAESSTKENSVETTLETY